MTSVCLKNNTPRPVHGCRINQPEVLHSPKILSTSFDNLRPMFFLVTWLLSLPSPRKNKKNLTNTNYSLSQGFGDSVGSFEMHLAIFAESDDRKKLLKSL